MCDIGDLEPCSVWTETERKARKRHRCACCRGPIEPGQKYVYHFDLHEGVLTYEKLCGACLVERQAFCDDHTDGTLCSGETFRRFLAECIAEGDAESERRWMPVKRAMEARARTWEAAS